MPEGEKQNEMSGLVSREIFKGKMAAGLSWASVLISILRDVLPVYDTAFQLRCLEGQQLYRMTFTRMASC